MGSRLEKNSEAVSKRIQQHDFQDEEGDEYGGSKFGGFPEYFRRKKIKLQNLDAQLRSETADKPKIFRGIVAHVNGYTQPSLNDLHRLVVSHGGGFMQYLDGKTTVTHIIASSLTPKKAVEFRRYRIVKPAWIVDSVNAGKLLPWHSYRVLDEGVGQKVLDFEDGKITSQASNRPRGYRDQTDTSWYTGQLKKGSSAPTQRPSQLLTPGTSSPFDEIEDFEGPGKAQNIGKLERKRGQVTPKAGPAGGEITSSVEEQFAQDLDLVEEDTEDGGVPLPPMVDDNAEEEHLGVQSAERREADHDGDSEAAEVADANASEDQKGAEHDAPLPAAEAIHLSEPLVQKSEAAAELSFIVGVEDASSSAAGQKRKTEAIPESPSKRAKLTAEEHNAILLSDPRIRQSSVLNPDFLEQYYRESRLHHLSTWKADLKAQLQALTAEQSSTQKAKQRRAPGARRYILHVDFDSFFVAVSLKKHPEWIDKPACVAHGPGPNSEIASCNYSARALGIQNGGWMKYALEKCKDLKVLPYDFPAYEEASRLFYEAIMSTGGIIQSVSIDEALVDVTAFCLPAGGTDGTSVREGSIWREQEEADEIAQGLRDRVKKDTGCAVSVGIGNNILLAKVALRKAKPAGQYQIKPEEALDFIGGLLVQDLPGVAYSIGGKLEEIGIKFVKDIREITKERLTTALGPKTGEKLWNYSRAIDRAEVGEQVIRKSVSAEVNWGVRFETQEQAEEFVESLCGELYRRLEKERVKGKQLTMKIMRRAADAPLDPPKHLGHGKCDTYNKSVVLGVATNEKTVLIREVMSIFRAYNFSPGELRGLGVQMTKLEPVKGILGDAVSSQRRLPFKAGPTPKIAETVPSPAPEVQRETAQAGEQGHTKAKPADEHASQARPHFRPTQRTEKVDDPIQDDPQTPKKPKFTSSKQVSIVSHIDSPGRRPLNTLGTQFIIPTQFDRAVLDELPPDIRAKLEKHIGDKAPVPAKTPAAAIDSTEAAAKRLFPATVLPNQSQLDPAILMALPDDVRAEILDHYALSPTNRKKGGQSRLPQSPHKDRLAPARTTSAARGRGRGRPKGGTNLLSRLKAARNDPTLTQTNFVSNHGAASKDNTTDSEADGEEAGGPRAHHTATADISPEFLEALPEDIRQEVLAQHRRDQLKRTAGIEIARRRRGGRAGGTTKDAVTDQLQLGHIIMGDDGNKERVMLLQPKPARPTFTSKRLSDIAQLRDAINLWYDEFEEEGPYQEDIEALGQYLKSVVIEEGDMHKAVEVVKWTKWVISQGNIDGAAECTKMWTDALEVASRCVNQAAQSRGLGNVVLDV